MLQNTWQMNLPPGSFLSLILTIQVPFTQLMQAKYTGNNSGLVVVPGFCSGLKSTLASSLLYVAPERVLLSIMFTNIQTVRTPFRKMFVRFQHHRYLFSQVPWNPLMGIVLLPTVCCYRYYNEHLCILIQLFLYTTLPELDGIKRYTYL